MDIPAIRASIALAKRQERETGHLRQLLAGRLPGLHRAIRVPARAPVAALFSFVVDYIERVPDSLEAAAGIAAGTAMARPVLPVLQLAADYFLKPSELAESKAGLHELMYEAYLAHRLLEEADDRYAAPGDIHLASPDTLAANLICHHLIGEPFANALDMAAEFSVEQLQGRTMITKLHMLQGDIQTPQDRKRPRQCGLRLTPPRSSIDLRLAGLSDRNPLLQ